MIVHNAGSKSVKSSSLLDAYSKGQSTAPSGQLYAAPDSESNQIVNLIIDVLPLMSFCTGRPVFLGNVSWNGVEP